MGKLQQSVATFLTSWQKQVPAEQDPNAKEHLAAEKRPRASEQSQKEGEKGRKWSLPVCLARLSCRKGASLGGQKHFSFSGLVQSCSYRKLDSLSTSAQSTGTRPLLPQKHPGKDHCNVPAFSGSLSSSICSSHWIRISCSDKKRTSHSLVSLTCHLELSWALTTTSPREQGDSPQPACVSRSFWWKQCTPRKLERNKKKKQI